MTATRHTTIDFTLGRCSPSLTSMTASAASTCATTPTGRRRHSCRRCATVVVSLPRRRTSSAAYFAGERQDFDLRLAATGSEFQRQVWAALRAIPYGTTTTYGAIAEQIGARGAHAARAVGTANGHNPISVVVPCHRVIGAGGRLTGYAGGLENKRKLLALEARVAAGAPDLDEDTCFAAMAARDQDADGTFVIGVRTTGVYCRPSCAGRPDRENVVFLPDPAAARRRGLRACKRCSPDTVQVRPRRLRWREDIGAARRCMVACMFTSFAGTLLTGVHNLTRLAAK